MNASVAPISFDTSISARRVRIWRRMVLKVTAASPAPSSALRSQIATRPILARAARRRAQAASAWTCATPGSPASSAARARPMSSPRGVTTKASGSGLRPSAAISSATPCTPVNSLSACSRGTKRTLAIRRSARSVAAERVRVGALRAGLQEDRNLRVEREASGDAAQVLQQRIAARGERERHADDERAEQRRAASRRSASAGGLAMLTQPGRSCDAPLLEPQHARRRSARPRRLVVRGDQDRHADLVEARRTCRDSRGRLRVEIRRGLVADQDRRAG